MTLIDLFYLNTHLSIDNRFTKEQWKDIIDTSFTYGNELCFNNSVEKFYIDWLEFDYEDCEDLITNIQNGDGDSFDRFLNDIVNFFNK